MKLTEEQVQEFNAAARPLIKWISTNCHPHTQIIIDSIHAELYEGVHVLHTEEYLKD